MIGLGAAIDYLNAVGMERIAEHERRLTEQAHERLRRISRLRIIGPEPKHKAGIVSFTVDDADPQDIAKGLDRFGIAVRGGYHCAMPLHERLGITGSVRASFYLYNTHDEVDYLADALEQVCHDSRQGPS